MQKIREGNNYWVDNRSFFYKKEAQKKFPVQIPYHIKISLQEYYENFDEWLIPDFSDKCPICGGANCACYLGIYTRGATCPITGFFVTDLPVLRFLCSRKGKAIVCDHITFSLLPLVLVPYRRLSLKFMVLAVWLRISNHLSLTSALDAIENEFNYLEDIADFINISSMLSWEQMVLLGARLLLSSDIDLASKIQCGQCSDIKELLPFLDILIHHKTRIKGYFIRGPDAFAWEFYQQSGRTDQCAPFLFGRASQHRR